jgi:AraC-like DNA-binding protein
MSYRHQFIGRTEGIHPTAPLRWRGLDGLISAFWEAEGEAGGGGYYISDNPRISIFFTDVSSIRVAERGGAVRRTGRPMARAFYVPAGTPIWTSFTSPLSFSHLDIHLNPEKVVKFLAPSVGRSAALDVIRRPAEVEETRDLEMLARLLVEEVTTPARHDLYAESLAASLVAGVLDLGEGRADRVDGRLTRAQMRKIVARVEAGGGRRLLVAEMAEAVGLSESWFSHVFKNTTGMTPLQWQSRRRIDLAKTLLGEGVLSISEIADRLGFSDQAHLTRVFHQVEGETPAAWRRAHRAA